jgi:Zn-dependent peptidase ImmA (M78 family)
MSRSAYYEAMKALAQSKRNLYGIRSDSINLTQIRRIYKNENIRIDLWDFKSPRIRAAYFSDNDGISVAVNKRLPKEPRLFSLIHELKHHYVDRKALASGKIQCGDYNANEVVEIGAEVFAAEFIYPEKEMRELADQLEITSQNCTKGKIVEFKRSSPAPISYIFIVKRFEWFRYCSREDFKGVQFQKLEEELYGSPIYKQPWFQRHQARKKTRLCS